MGDQHKCNRCERRQPRIGYKVIEMGLILRRGRELRQRTRGRLPDIVERPSRHDRVETIDQKCRQHAIVTNCDPRSSWSEFAVSAYGIEAGVFAHEELGCQHGDTHNEQTEQIDNEECSTTALARDVGEAPDVAQADSTADRNEYYA